MQGDILKTLHPMNGAEAVEVEEESLWKEVTQLLRMRVLFSERPLTSARILLFPDWEEQRISYRMEGDDNSSKGRFALEYNPRRISNIKERAVKNGYRTKYNPTDSAYEAGTLEIEMELT